MDPSVAVVVPFFNSSDMLARCLHAVLRLDPPPHKVLLIDDGSTDDSAAIAAKFPFEVIRHAQNRGRMKAKLGALSLLKEDIAVLIDSDVICSPDSLRLITEKFKEDPALSCLSLVPAPKNSHQGFLSRFKAVYMHQVLKTAVGETDFSHGCLQALRIQDVLAVRNEITDEFRPDDIHLGLLLAKHQKRITLTDELMPIHERSYSIGGLLKKDFIVPREFVRMLVHHRQFTKSLKQRRFTHASIEQVSAIACTYTAILFPALTRGSFGASLILLLGAALLRRGFIREARRQHGSIFALQAMAFSWVDHLIMGAGMLTGLAMCLRMRGHKSWDR